MNGFIIPFVRSPYNYDTGVASDESGLACLDPSLATQEARDEVDINTIVRRFGLTGELPQGLRAPSYGDFTGIGDYQSALNAVLAAEATFNQVPAEVRARFANDPQRFLAFCSDPANADELEKLGLLSDAAVQRRRDAAAAKAAEQAAAAAAAPAKGG